MKINKKIIESAQILWNYHLMEEEPVKSDLILVLGSHDLRVAERGAELFLKDYAEKILFSGGLGDLTKNIWTKPEAEMFANIAIKMGIPKTSILIENKSTNTGENIINSYQLIKNYRIKADSIILVQKPYMERRTYATFKKQWPDEKTNITITSPQIKFEDYPTEEIPLEKVINVMVGDLQRIIEYPKKGFQIYQEVPRKVISAYEFLITEGFTNRLIKD